MSSISKSIGKLSILEELYLSGNQLESLPDEICTLPKLKILNIEENKLNSLPAKIGDMAVEELYADILLQRAYLAADGRLRQVQLVRRMRE